MNAIICAAIRDPKSGKVIKGFRHFDCHMRHKIEYLKLKYEDFTEEGFIDKYGEYKTREEALKIVKMSGQYLILEGLGNPDSTELYSEGLYE